MDRKHLTIGTIALLVGAVGGGIGGYRLGSCGSVMRAESNSDRVFEASTTRHPPDADSLVNAVHTGPMDDQLENKVFQHVPFEEEVDLEEFISWFQCRSFENDHQLRGGIQIAVGHPLVHERSRSKIRFRYDGRNVTARQVLDEFSAQTGISYSIKPCVVLWGREKAANEAEQGADGKTPEAPQPPK